MFSKIDVNGPNAHDVYKYLRSNSELYNNETKEAGDIPWNFAKFLINGDGHVVGYWGPKTPPLELVPEIEKLL